MLYEKLYTIRNEHNMPQWKVAKFIGINKQTYHLKETGKSDFTIPEAKRLAMVFGCTLDKLFGDGEKQVDPSPKINKEADGEIIHRLDKIIDILKNK